MNITVTPPDNVAPVANDDPVDTSENAALEFRLADLIANDTDANGDPLTVTAINGVLLDDIDLGDTITLGSGATLVRTGATTFVYLPGTVFDSLNPGETAADQFSYAISDGRGGESTASVNITINGENDAPVAVADTATAVSPGPQTLIYFSAQGNFLETGGGRELYAFNPATGALKLVADVNSVDSQGSDPQELTPLDGKLYFVANGNDATGNVGYELFVYQSGNERNQARRRSLRRIGRFVPVGTHGHRRQALFPGQQHRCGHRTLRPRSRHGRGRPRQGPQPRTQRFISHSSDGPRWQGLFLCR